VILVGVIGGMGWDGAAFGAAGGSCAEIVAAGGAEAFGFGGEAVGEPKEGCEGGEDEEEPVGDDEIEAGVAGAVEAEADEVPGAGLGESGDGFGDGRGPEGFADGVFVHQGEGGFAELTVDGEIAEGDGGSAEEIGVIDVGEPDGSGEEEEEQRGEGEKSEEAGHLQFVRLGREGSASG
jgi:hypothetical protein